jgi:hypothetical protein
MAVILPCWLAADFCLFRLGIVSCGVDDKDSFFILLLVSNAGIFFIHYLIEFAVVLNLKTGRL